MWTERPMLGRGGNSYPGQVNYSAEMYFWARFVVNDTLSREIGAINKGGGNQAHNHAEQRFLRDTEIPALPNGTTRIELDVKAPPCARPSQHGGPRCCERVFDWCEEFPNVPVYLFVREADQTENLIDTFGAGGQFQPGWRCCCLLSPGDPAEAANRESAFRLYQSEYHTWQYWEWIPGEHFVTDRYH